MAPSHTRSDLAAALSIGAGLVHAAAAGTHSGDATLVWLFTASALAQVLLGVALLSAPSRRLLVAVAGINVVCVAAWALSRTTGLPLVASLAGREEIGSQDLVCALLGAAAATVAVWTAVRPEPRLELARRLVWLPALALVPAVIGVAAPHEHSGHAHDEGAEHAHADGAEPDGHSHDHEQSEGASALAADPALAGADTGHATEAQLTAAVDLVDSTRAVVGEGFTDVASAEAAGYVWIGDGRRVGTYQHYINRAYLSDGRELDPDHIESLVFENTAEGPELVTTMYILEAGSTMADVPDVAGDLTVWHDHQNLCWDATGTRLAGVSTDGTTCVPGGTFRATPPMLHVWLTDNECGPFAGVEGHQAEASACAPHEH